MYRIPVMYYKKVVVGRKEYFLISACKWSGWWEFLAYDKQNRLYHIEVNFDPSQEEELDVNLRNPEGSYTIKNYQDVVVNKLTPDRLIRWNTLNMESGELGELEWCENHPLEEVLKNG